MIDLAYRSNVVLIDAKTVYENDDFIYEFGLDPKLKLVPTKGDRGEPILFYGMFKTKDGGFGFDVMSINEIRAHAKKYSQSYASEYSPWKTNFEEMAKKTVLKRALKYAPMSTDFIRKISADETVKTEISDDMFSVPNETIEVEGHEVDASTGEVQK